MSIDAQRNGNYFFAVLNVGIAFMDCRAGEYGWAIVALLGILLCVLGIRDCGWWPRKDSEQ